MLFNIILQSFLACFIVGFGSTIGWLFAFDREILILSFFILILSAAGIYGAVAILHKRVYDNLKILNTKEHRGINEYTLILVF